jgi:tRNA(fMet)-specific endonuclease VapC
MTRYLLDTNAFSHAVKGTLSNFSDRFAAVALEDVAVSVITEAELLFGLVRRPQAHELSRAVHELLSRIAILPWTSNAAKQYADLRFALEAKGQPIGAMDMMIAAHALAEDAVLVTNDAAFRRIERLKLEDWARP